MVNRPTHNPPPRRLAKRLLVAFALLACAAGAGAQMPAAIPWSSRDLEVPYRWTGSIAGATSVVLYYSADQGRSWKTAGQAAPHVRSFRFNAPNDGEYWFAIRTYDAANRPAPGGPLAAEMRVQIDTGGPKVDLLSADLVGNELRVDLRANDLAGVNAEAVRLYAQADGQPGWLPVPVVSSDPSPDGRSLHLTARWIAPPGASTIDVRATVEDLAGNRTERTASASRAATTPINLFAAKPTPRSPFQAAAQPAAQPSWGRLASTGGASTRNNGAIDPFALAERNPAPFPTTQAPPQAAPLTASPYRGAPKRVVPRRETATAPLSTPWPAESRRSAPLVADSRPTQNTPFSSASFGSNLGGTFDRPSAFADDIPRRLVNNTEFEFDYELEETGRWGVAKVELWGTDNGGQSWRRFAVDSDRQSPIHVTAPGEGEFGFRLVVESVGGLQAPTPRPGDAPEAVIGVDLQKPTVALRGARQGDGYFADQLIIEWRASDEHLADRPIDLFYSNRETGPWIPVATNLPNSGRHTWRLQRHLPRRMHLRLEARDQAGNTAATTTPEALEIEVPVASGSLQGVRAANRL